MKPNQVDLLSSSVFRDLQQIKDTKEPRLAREFGRDIREADGFDRIHDDLTTVHRIASADFHVRSHPDADAAGDLSFSNTFAQAFGEKHDGLFQPGETALNIVERRVLLRKREAHEAASELRIRGIKARPGHGRDADLIDEPIGEGHVVIAASQTPKIRHNVVRAFGNSVLEAMAIENSKHS